LCLGRLPLERLERFLLAGLAMFIGWSGWAKEIRFDRCDFLATGEGIKCEWRRR
jgi:hypothetical protein